MKKHAFTILEILLTFTIIMVIAGASVPFVFKKNFLSKDTHHKTGSWECTCKINSSDDEVTTCTFDADSVVKTGSEYFVIQMTGGGGAGSPLPPDSYDGKGGKGGSAGESRTIYYPTMKGKYLVVLGKGGNYSATSSSGVSAPTNGGYTALYQIEEDKDGNIISYTLLESVRGGIVNNEACEDIDKTCPRGSTSCKPGDKGCFGEPSLFGKKNAGQTFYKSDDERELITFTRPESYKLKDGISFPINQTRIPKEGNYLEACSGACTAQTINGVRKIGPNCNEPCAVYGEFENEENNNNKDLIAAEGWIPLTQQNSCGDGGDPAGDASKRRGQDGEVTISWE